MKHVNGNKRRLRVFTWHIHGTYLYYLSQANVDFYLPVNSDRSDGYGGKSGDYPWGSNIHEIPVEAVRDAEFDIILFQHRQQYDVDQYIIFSENQHNLPKIYLDHEPPRVHPVDTRHFITDPSTVLVFVTNFNRLMWNSNGIPSMVIDHGVVPPKASYQGTLERGIVVINDLPMRGRRLGLDIFEYTRQYVPLDLVGINSETIGGLGALPHDELSDFIAQYRFFFNPIRYTSLGLSILEAMMVGLPVVGLATTELVSVIQSGSNGYLSLDPDELIGYMKTLLDDPTLARELGQKGRDYAQKRFSINRFVQDWENLFEMVHAGRRPAPALETAKVSP